MTRPERNIYGPYMLLRSGLYFNLENPEPSLVDIEDIAHALSNICRYTGHCSEFYSVPQHSVLGSYTVPQCDALAGLLHDAAEAYIGDVAAPLKGMLPDYRAVERRMELAVFRRFGLPDELPASVKWADRVLLRTEQRDLMGADSHVWAAAEGVQPLPGRIKPFTPVQSKGVFLERFWQLTGAAGVAV